MREANFSIPNANKASVGITTALYDRRALDCTSTLPLINSLNHLAYLTNSSARIREILTIDGGVEKLISILKDGRCSDVMEAWKWNLAFQCVVNIGVRGSDARSAESRSSENVRTRVVEADIVPVIATILNNYMQALEKWKAKQGIDPDVSRSRAKPSRSSRRAALGSELHTRANASVSSSVRTPEQARRRQALPAHLNLHRHAARGSEETVELNSRENDSQGEQVPQVNVVASASERPVFPQGQGQQQDSQPHRPRPSQWRRNSQDQRNGPSRDMDYPIPSRETMDLHGFTPMRDIDNLASPPALPNLGISSQPESPTTPTTAGRDFRSVSSRRSASVGRAVYRRPSLRRQTSSSGASEDDQAETQSLRPSLVPGVSGNFGEQQSDVDMDEVVGGSNYMNMNGDPSQDPEAVAVADVTGNAEPETFDIAIRSAEAGVLDPATTPTNATMQRLSPVPQQPFPAMPHAPEPPTAATMQPLSRPRMMPPSMAPVASPSVVRDEDVIMSLQLLAYVSKYTNLRTYFLNTHLVPKLQISEGELNAYETGQHFCQSSKEPASNDDEYCQENDFNIFPLVEKFTVRHHSSDMKDWAGVVMRNLCRKDKSRGDIRQCAYYECGKWEEFQRQFAKCRACRQTKYCSKECQKLAWVYHRHWCQQAERNTGAGPSSQPAPEAPSQTAASVAENWDAPDS